MNNFFHPPPHHGVALKRSTGLDPGEGWDHPPDLDVGVLLLQILPHPSPTNFQIPPVTVEGAGLIIGLRRADSKTRTNVIRIISCGRPAAKETRLS